MSNSKYTPHYRFISRLHGIVCSAHFLVLRAGDKKVEETDSELKSAESDLE
ncbi:hypothetical protein T08_1308 [Trichinella sp. T8]|nr:hypothetical protein T08_1308 [Trichinella sp. T8]